MRYLTFILSLVLSFSVGAEVKTVMVGNYEIEYEVTGTGNATILLEAGASGELSDWEPIYEDLAKHFITIRYSRVGHGNSSPIIKSYSSTEYAQDAFALINESKVEGKVVYIAHSYGAYIARIFASESEHDVDIMRRINLEEAEIEIAQIKLDDMKDGMSNNYLDFWAKRPLPDYPQILDIPVTVIASIKKYDNPSSLFFTDAARVMWGELHTDQTEGFPQGKSVLTNQSYHYPQNDEPEMVNIEIIELVNKSY